MEINVSPAPLEQSLSSDNRTSAFPVPKEPPLVQLQEPFVVSFLFSQLFNKKYLTKIFCFCNLATCFYFPCSIKC